MPSWAALNFQDASSPSMTELFFLSDHVTTVMAMVIVLIMYVMVFIPFSQVNYKFLSESTLMETIWSIVPAIMLIALVVPSMKILYLVEDIKTPAMTVKVIAHQWYWTYIYPMMGGSLKSLETLISNEVDSLILTEEVPRLLACSSYLYLPVNTSSRLLMTSTDVIHAFTVPALGLKVDALPGRTNQLMSMPSRMGEFFGQCSEICGSNHSFMPIGVKILMPQDYKNVLKIMGSGSILI